MSGILSVILTASEADAVRGETSPGYYLTPRSLADGVTWALPARVLSDPAHESKWHLITALPQRTVTPEEWPPSDNPEIP